MYDVAKMKKGSNRSWNRPNWIIAYKRVKHSMTKKKAVDRGKRPESFSINADPNKKR